LPDQTDSQAPTALAAGFFDSIDPFQTCHTCTPSAAKIATPLWPRGVLPSNPRRFARRHSDDPTTNVAALRNPSLHACANSVIANVRALPTPRSWVSENWVGKGADGYSDVTGKEPCQQ
jgi:hypothetical protein